MQIIKASDAKIAPHLNVGIYGASGAGKSTLLAKSWVTDPSKLVVGITEGQAEPIIRLWNPHATIVRLTTYQDVQSFYEWLHAGFRTGKWHNPQDGTDPATGAAKTLMVPTGDPFEFETYALDSISDVFRIVKHEITMRDHRRALQKYRASKGTAEGFDEPEVTSMQAWGILQDKMNAMLRAFRNLPANFVASFGLDEREEEGATAYRPYLQGRDVKSAVVGYFNGFGYAYKRIAEGEAVHEVAFRTNDQFTTKGIDGCDNVEEPDFKVWHCKFTERMAQAAADNPAQKGATKSKKDKE